MLFNSFIFFIFLGIVLPIFYSLPSKTGKNVFLLLASYFFYGYWDWRFCSLLLISTDVDLFIGKTLHKQEDEKVRKRLLTLSLVSNLGILAVFKYFNFFIDSFQTLATSFPQLVAGPIERAAALLPELSIKLSPSKEQIQQGIVLIISGLFRKVLLGDTAGRYVDNIFENMEAYHSVELICGLVLFSIQIYADFSGYSRVARGTSKLLGVELMKNFEHPYLSRNISEFWRRWHISLSSWLKDYL